MEIQMEYYAKARDFYAQYLHLGGIFVLDEATLPARAVFSANREARQPLPKEALSALMQCLTSAQMRASVAASATPPK